MKNRATMTAATPSFKALADETRLRLLHILNRHELNVNELVLILEMGQSRVSRHLKILSAAGLLTWRREGLRVFYSTPGEGERRDLIDAVLPFMENDPQFAADMVMAAGMIEERARRTRQFFNSIAEDWDKLSREVLGSFDLAGVVRERMPFCRVAADLGCGTGTVLAAMLDKAEKLIGVDGSPRMLELARRRFVHSEDQVSLRIGDLAHLPLRDAEADFVAINMVLHHVASPLEVLRETQRVLAPGGRLALTDFNRHADERMRADYGDLWLGFDAETLHSHLIKAEFRLLDSETLPVERSLALHVITAEKPATTGENHA
ncbi:MAG: metalloregulator ArsR/SmtB family transcription factor [Deltaproteobacteria bacterium]|jgi:ArsR family transcriptional regulator|nr:metalloregulator ArsR/SmtB family transcription factor [Deltaproteobacteria bacterium]